MWYTVCVSVAGGMKVLYALQCHANVVSVTSFNLVYTLVC